MEELDLKKLFNLFWVRKIEMLLIIAIFIAIGVVYTIGFVTPKYKSSTTLVLATANKGNETTQSTEAITTTDVTLNSKLISTYSELVKSKNVIRAVIANLNINISEDAIRNNIAVTSVKDTELIEITVTNTDPAIAAKVANETAKVFTQKISELYNINNVHVVDEAEEATTPSNVNHMRDIVIFALVGLVMSVVYTLVLNMLDNTIDSAEDIEELLKLPVLVSIPMCNLDKGGRR